MDLFYSGRKYLEERAYEKFWLKLSYTLAGITTLMISFQIIRYFIYFYE